MTGTSKPHFSTNEAASTAFARMVGVDPRRAVYLVLGRGLSLRPEDVPTPHLVQLAALPRELRTQYELLHAPMISSERAARKLVFNQDNVFRANEETAAQAQADARAAFIVARMSELEAAYWTALRAKWRERAEIEANERFPDPTERGAA